MGEQELKWINLAFDKEGANEDAVKENGPAQNENNTKGYELNANERQREVRSIQKNLALIAIEGVLVTSPMGGLINSATSLLDDEGLGITSLAACSICQFLASAFLISYANKVLGVRKMVSAALMFPVPFIVSYVYPSWVTTLPAGILLGLAQAFITSIFMYGSVLGYYYAQLTDGNSDVILFAISGLLSSCLGGGLFFGNIILFSILNNEPEVDNLTASMNVSYDICGVNYCNEELTHLPTMEKPEPWRYYTLVGVFSVMAILGSCLILFVRDFSVELRFVPRKKSEYFQIMRETLGLLTHPRGYLLVFFSIFIGVEETFILADYTHSYISCTIGIPKVGFIMLAFGGVQIVVCVAQGLLVKFFGRIAVIVFGLLMLMSCFITVFLWHPDSEQVGIFFLIAILWAAGDAILIPTSFALYGMLFEDNIEGALALATFWWSVGVMMAYVWTQFLCIAVKLYITIIFGFLTLVCYVILEIMIWKKMVKKTK